MARFVHLGGRAGIAAGADAIFFFGCSLPGGDLTATSTGDLPETAGKKKPPAVSPLLLCSSIIAAIPFSFAAFLTDNRAASMGFMAAAIFLLFFSTGPVNTL